MKTFSFSCLRGLWLFFFFLQSMSFALATENIAPAGGEARYFIVTAYYSPLPGQTRYLRGNYLDEIALNGNGTHGADGTPVYAGMLAAPRGYVFGTKIYIPGMGVGTVHDRGGAIVSAGNRGHAHDRIDVWMGYGDDGLSRALSWGKRTVLGVVYPPSSPVKESLTYHGIWKTFSVSPPSFVLEKGKQGEAVKRLQKRLADAGFFTGTFDGKFDEETEKAVLAFQLKNGVISSPNDRGAGVFGPKTRKALYAFLQQEEEKKERETEHFARLLPAGLFRGQSNDAVGHLQQALKRLSYFSGKVTSVFDEETEKAVLAFQLKNGVVSSPNDRGAGVFGPKTQSTMLTLLYERKKEHKPLLFAQREFGGAPRITVKKKNPLPPSSIKPVLTHVFPEKKTTTAVAGYSPSREGMSMRFE